jgi:hypothetical protein
MNVEPHHYLRTEGLVVAAVALATYFTLDGSLWLLAVLALAPDISMLGYLAGPRVGALVYNTAHTYTLPLALGAVGFYVDARLALLVALVWAGHIGADRALGYGLKYESGFKDTHLSSQPVPSSLLKR